MKPRLVAEPVHEIPTRCESRIVQRNLLDVIMACVKIERERPVLEFGWEASLCGIDD